MHVTWTAKIGKWWNKCAVIVTEETAGDGRVLSAGVHDL